MLFVDNGRKGFVGEGEAAFGSGVRMMQKKAQRDDEGIARRASGKIGWADRVRKSGVGGVGESDNAEGDTVFEDDVFDGLLEETDRAAEGDHPDPPASPFRWLPVIPLCFLGLGVYRAWIELVFVGSFVDYPAAHIATHDLFDIVMISTMMLCAVLAKKTGPYYHRTWLYVVSGAALVASTVAMFVSLAMPAYAAILGYPAAVFGGMGIALVILLWSELYGCLNPFRVALYYSASMIVAAFIIYFARGLSLPWLGIMATMLPLVTLAAVAAAFRSLPHSELPQIAPTKFSFPWKIAMLMAVYAFAYGLKEASLYQTSFGPHSAFGTLAVATIVFFGTTAHGGKFDFAIIYRIALPLMVGAFLIVPNIGVFGQSVSDFCASASYTAFSLLIMLIMANLCYRYGMSAIFLFGIERGVRALFTLLGRQAESAIGGLSIPGANADFVINSLVVIMVVAATMILFSEKELSSRWGVVLLSNPENSVEHAVVKKQELGNRCHKLAQDFGLSPREEEVLLLLAQRKTVGSIEKELFIANGTAKTHIRHIYRKLDIHSRDELTDLLGLFE